MDHVGDAMDVHEVPLVAPRTGADQVLPPAPGTAADRAGVPVQDRPGTRDAEPASTQTPDYTRRLVGKGGARWKRVLDVQAPYRWNVRRLNLGRTLDVGCGIGRNLAHLGGNGVGVDHNPTSIATAREQGLVAYTPDEFRKSEYARPGAFDSLLVAHVLEHLPEEVGRDLVGTYLPYVRPGGRCVFVTPQQRGYRSDPTHVRFVGFDEVTRLAGDLGLTVDRRYSFPLPRTAGPVFTYNEFVVVCRIPDRQAPTG